MKVFLSGLLLCTTVLMAAGARADEFFETVLPADTIAVLSASDLGTLFEQASKTPLGKILASDPEISKNLSEKINRVKLLASLVMNLPDSQRDQLIDTACAIALLPVRQSMGQTQNLSVVVAFDFSSLDQAAQDEIKRAVTGVLRLVLQGKGEISVLKDGCEVKLAETKNQQIKLLFKEGTVLVGFASDIDALPADDTLAQNQFYKDIKSEMPKGEKIAGYLNVDALLAELDRRRPNIERMEKLKQLGIKNVAGAVFSTEFTQAGIQQDVYVQLHQPKTSWLQHIPTDKAEVRGDRFVPRGFDLLVSANFGSGVQIVDAFRSAIAEVAGTAGLQNWDNWLDSIGSPFSVSVKADVMASIGGEVFYAADYDHLADSITRSSFETGRTYLLGCKLAENAGLGAALNRIFESDVLWSESGLERTVIDYNGCSIVSLSSTVEPWIQDAYCFIDGYFLYSPKLDTLKQALDAYRTGRNLTTDLDYAKMKSSTPKEQNIFTYGRSSVIYDQLLETYLPYMDSQIKSVATTVSENNGLLSDAVSSLVVEDDCIRLRLLTPMGIEGILISSGKFKEAAIRRKVHISREALREVQSALEAYYEKNGTYPSMLESLQPEFLQEMPEDPFAEYGGFLVVLLDMPPMPVRYYPESTDKKITAYALAANGPDGTIDFSPVDYDPALWAAKQPSADADMLATMKAALYQYKPNAHEDESGLEDEGDIVIFHKAEQGGPK